MVELANEVVARCRDGDAAACRDLLAAFERPIYQTVFRLVGGRYPNEVEDIAQDVFLKIFRSLDRFDPARGVKFSTWVYTFVKNHCFDVLKKRRLMMVGFDDRRAGTGEAGLALDPVALQPAPWQGAAYSELERRVADAVYRLPEDQRLAFVLREYEGLDYREIAIVASCSEGTVKSRLHRAKEALRHTLRKHLP